MASKVKEFKRQIDNARRGAQETIERKWDGLKKQVSSKEDKVSGKQSEELGDDPLKIIKSVESRLKEERSSLVLVGPARRLSGEAEGLLRKLQKEDPEKFNQFAELASKKDTKEFYQRLGKLEGEAADLEYSIRQGDRIVDDEKMIKESKTDIRNLKSLRKLKLEQKELKERKSDIKKHLQNIQVIKAELSGAGMGPDTGGGDMVDKQDAVKRMRAFDWRSSSPAEKKKELEQQITARQTFLQRKLYKREARLQEIDDFLSMPKNDAKQQHTLQTELRGTHSSSSQNDRTKVWIDEISKITKYEHPLGEDPDEIRLG